MSSDSTFNKAEGGLKGPAGQAGNKRIEMLRSGPIGSTLFKLSAPAIAGMLVMAVYNVVDTFFVSLLHDTSAIAATGVVFPVFQLAGSIGLTFGLGAASVISRKLGARQYKEAHEVAATALYSAAVVGGILAVIGVLAVNPLLRIFGATPSILETAATYGRIIIGGSIFLVINMTLNNLLRSEGSALYSSIGQMSGAVINIILDPIFIFVFDMGIMGAAVATVIAQAFGTLFLLTFYLRRKGTLNPLSLRHVRLHISTYKSIMALGLPTFVRQVLGSLSFGVMNNAAGIYGDSAIAAISINLRIFGLLFMSLIGLAQGLQPLAGYNFGAGQKERVRQTISLGFRVAIIIGLGAGLGGFLGSKSIISVFAAHDEQVIRLGAEALRYMSLALIPIGLVIMFGGVFQALGDGRSAMLLASGQQGLFLIPLIIILPHYFGVTGVFAAMPLGFVFAFCVGGLLMIRTWRKLLQG